MVDEQAIQELAALYQVQPVMLPRMAHDMPLVGAAVTWNASYCIVRWVWLNPVCSHRKSRNHEMWWGRHSGSTVGGGGGGPMLEIHA